MKKVEPESKTPRKGSKRSDGRAVQPRVKTPLKAKTKQTNSHEVVRAFAEAAQAHGVLIDQPNGDGRTYRCDAAGGKVGNKSAEYCLYLDGHPAGWFKNWRTGAYKTWSHEGRSLTQAQRRGLESSHAVARHKREAERKRRFAAARKKALEIWKNAKELTEDDLGTIRYLKSKQISEPKAVRRKSDINDALLVPVYDEDERLVSLQGTSIYAHFE
jgi:putative DNA primase/helicase